jgi:hypothetical protein
MKVTLLIPLHGSSCSFINLVDILFSIDMDSFELPGSMRALGKTFDAFFTYMKITVQSIPRHKNSAL